MRNICRFILLLMPAFLMAACHNRAKQAAPPQGELIATKYAKGFTILENKQYTTVTVMNPWQEGSVYARYYLVKDSSTEVPSDGTKVAIPLRSMAANSATHLEFLQLLGILDKVTGVCNSRYIYNPRILERVKDGTVKDLGDAFQLDIEQLLLLRPQAVMTSAYNAEDENSQKLRHTGITLLYNIEWQEENILGRAEWIKFIGAFYDKSNMADSIFTEIERSYNRIKEQAAKASSRPSIMSGEDFRGTWSIPAGRSFTAQLFRDAGAAYLYADETGKGSIPSDIENMLLRFKDADIWVGVQANTLKELGEKASQYQLFKAYREGNVYNYNKRTTPEGGNDYWESAVARPDILLADLIKVFHPELLPEHELFYMMKLE